MIAGIPEKIAVCVVSDEDDPTIMDAWFEFEPNIYGRGATIYDAVMDLYREFTGRIADTINFIDDIIRMNTDTAFTYIKVMHYIMTVTFEGYQKGLIASKRQPVDTASKIFGKADIDPFGEIHRLIDAEIKKQWLDKGYLDKLCGYELPSDIVKFDKELTKREADLDKIEKVKSIRACGTRWKVGEDVDPVLLLNYNSLSDIVTVEFIVGNKVRRQDVELDHFLTLFEPMNDGRWKIEKTNTLQMVLVEPT